MRLISLLCITWCLQAAVIDAVLPNGKTMLVISSDPTPTLPWTYGSVVHVAAQPGDTIRLPAGNYSHILLWKLQGTEAAPILVTNHGGRVSCENTDTWSALTVYGCQHLRLSGTGSPGVRYGLHARTSRGGAHSVQVLGDSDHIEIDHVEISGAGFAGFNVKNEISSSGTWNRGQMEMNHIHLHHNWVHDTSGEGFYCGHTFYNGKDVNNDGTLEYPHFLRHLVIEHNIIERTGAEGIQVGSTHSGMIVRYNTVIDPGIDPFAAYQNNGIQIGMSSGLVHANTVIRARGNGIIVLSQGDNILVANVIIDAGSNGFFIDDRASSPASIASGGALLGPGFRVLNNTIIHPGKNTDLPAHNRSGVRIYGADLANNWVWNTVVVGGSGSNYAVSPLNNSMPLNEQATSWSIDGHDFMFRQDGSWAPTTNSTLINRGVDVTSHGSWTDRLGRQRPQGATIDRGAFEFLPRSVQLKPTKWHWDHAQRRAQGSWFHQLDADDDQIFTGMPHAVD